MYRSAANLARKPAYTMALEDAIDPCVRNLDVMITGAKAIQWNIAGGIPGLWH
jgi:hypothetical protein